MLLLVLDIFSFKFSNPSENPSKFDKVINKWKTGVHPRWSSTADTQKLEGMSGGHFLFLSFSSREKPFPSFPSIKYPQPQQDKLMQNTLWSSFHSIRFNILNTVDKDCSFQKADEPLLLTNACFRTTSALTFLDEINSALSNFPYGLYFLTLSLFSGSILELLSEHAAHRAAHTTT